VAFQTSNRFLNIIKMRQKGTIHNEKQVLEHECNLLSFIGRWKLEFNRSYYFNSKTNYVPSFDIDWPLVVVE
jgi:hypothetical protein